MRIGIPREIKVLEGRVGLIPGACSDLLAEGHEVLLESGAGLLSGYTDSAYQAVGVQVVPDAEALYRAAQLVVKVKEPVAGDLQWLRHDHLLFCYLHLAANETLARQLQSLGITAVAFETVEEATGELPLLAPMSDIAGRLAVQIGGHLLHAPQGGKGLLLGGLPGAERGHVVVLGGGSAGTNAARLAAATGARVTVFDRKRERMVVLRELGPNVTALYPYAEAIEQAVREADLLVGAVLVTGARSPHLVGAAQVAAMSPGSVIVDISVDQGGCIATTRPTTYAEPTYTESGVVHFCVTNMPGAVPRSASQALSAALIPYVRQLAGGQWENHAALQRGINLQQGRFQHPALIDLFSGK